MISDERDMSHISSKEIKVDTKLEFSTGKRVKEKIKQIIAHSVPTVKTLEEKLDCLKKVLQKQMSFPNNYLLATIANGLYDDYEKLHIDEDGEYKHGKEIYPNWKLLCLAYDSGSGSEEITAGTAASLVSNAIAREFMDSPNGYCGAAYWNSLTQQVVITHCGTKNKGGVYADVYGVLLNEHVPQIDSAVTFTDVITSVLREINDERGSNIQLFITGHSLGAWLASITVFSAKHLRREDDCFVENPDFDKSGYYSTAVVFDGPGCEEMLRRIQSRLFNRYAGPSLITSLDITNYLSAPNLINACNLHVGDVYRLFIPLTEEDEKHLTSLRKKNFVQKFVECVKRHSVEMHVVVYTSIMHRMKSLMLVFDPETGDVLSDNGNLRIQKVIDWPLLTSSDKKEEIRSKIFHGGIRVLEVLGTLVTEVFGILSATSLIGRVIRLVYQGLDVIYKTYNSAKWYEDLMHELNKFLKLANETNSFQPHKSDKYFAETGREIRYETKMLDDTYKNEHSLNVFTPEERQFVEQFKYLELCETDLDGIVRLDEIFGFFKDEMALYNVRKMLKFYKVDNLQIISKDLQKCILCIKCMLNLFPETLHVVRKACQNLPLHIHKKIYQRISSSYLNSFKMFLDFNGDTFGLQEFLRDENKTIMHLVTRSTSLGVVRAYITFSNITRNFHVYEEADSCLFFSLKGIFCLGADVFISFLKKIDFKHLLFLECDCKLDFGVREFLRNLFKILKEKWNCKNDHIKAILITSKGKDLAKFISEHLKINSFAYREENKEVMFDDLTIESQKELLETRVIFQGISVSFSKVVNGCSTLNIILDEETIVELYQKNLPLEIGKRIQSLDDSESYYYIDREVAIKGNVKKQILIDEDLSDIFAVSNVSKEQLSETAKLTGEKAREFSEKDLDVCNPTRFILLDDNFQGKNHFKRLCEEYPTRSIHWLSYIGFDFMLLKSHGTLCGLRPYLRYYNNYELPEEYYTDSPYITVVKFNDIDNFDEKVVIIAAEPGMGKTTALTQLASRKRDDFKWIIQTNLMEHKKKLKEVKFDEITDVVDFFCDRESVNELTRKLFLSRINETGNIVFLLDGFDEITSEGQNHVINLLKLLQNTAVERVFITSRLHLRTVLEDNFSTLAYSFKPFFKDDQEKFLKRFWKNVVDPEINEYLLKDYIEYLLQHTVRDYESSFMRTPLHLRMVAEAFQRNIQEKARFDSPKKTLPENFDRLKLYEFFIRIKYRFYLTKKRAQNIETDDEMEDTYLDTYGKVHRFAAFKYLFPEYEKIFFKDKYLSEPDKQMLNLIGIVQIINDEIVFIHHTFAEYFVADFLARRLKRCYHHEKHKAALYFLTQEIFHSAHAVKNYLRNWTNKFNCSLDYECLHRSIFFVFYYRKFLTDGDDYADACRTLRLPRVNCPSTP